MMLAQLQKKFKPLQHQKHFLNNILQPPSKQVKKYLPPPQTPLKTLLKPLTSNNSQNSSIAPCTCSSLFWQALETKPSSFSPQPL